MPDGGAGNGLASTPPGAGWVLVGVPLKSGAGSVVSGGGGLDAPGMYGVLAGGGVVVTGGPTTGALPAGTVVGVNGGGAAGVPTPGPPPGGVGQTPPYAPAPVAGGLAGQK